MRVNMYWRSNTVITCWVIWTELAEEEDLEEPRDLQAGMQVRRIVQHKCILEGMTRIIKAPSTLPEITSTLLTDKGGGHALLQLHKAKISSLTHEQTSFLQARHHTYKYCVHNNEHSTLARPSWPRAWRGVGMRWGWPCAWCARCRWTP